jgi:hypothetical protein
MSIDRVLNGIQLVNQIREETNKNIEAVCYFFWKFNEHFIEDSGFRYSIANPKLVVCFSYETGLGFDNLNFSDALKTVIKNFHETIDAKNIIFVVGGIYNEKVIPNFAKKMICPTPYLHWMNQVLIANPVVDYTGCDNRKYLFESLFGGKRPERIRMFNFLKDNKLLERSLVSIKDNNVARSSDLQDYETSELWDLERDEIKEFKKEWTSDKHTAFEIEVDFVGKVNEKVKISMTSVISPKIYQNSWFSIVCETLYDCYDNNVHFITEKTGKCLFAKRIFVCLAPPKHLEKVRELGFKTFDGIIDESYDLEYDPNKRFNMVCKQILWISIQNPIELYEKAKPILEHNFKIMTETDLGIGKIKDFIIENLNKIPSFG